MIKKNTDTKGTAWLVGSEPLNIECVYAGDRVIFRRMIPKDPLTFDVVPDADGFMPHFAYVPQYAGQASQGTKIDPTDPRTYRAGGAAFGNADTSGKSRVDLCALYCPFAGNVTLEGGQVPPGATGEVTVQWVIDRNWMQRMALNRAGNGYANQSYTSGIAGIPQTRYNVPDGAVIERPDFVANVIVPEGRQITLAMRAVGGYSVTVPAINNGQPIPLGPFLYIKNGGALINWIRFGVEM